MALLIFGQLKAPIGIDQVFCRCAACEKDTWSEMMVESVYFHIFWIPLFPFDKTLNLNCEECGNKRYGLPFNQSTVPNYKEIKSRFPHPVRTYLVVTVFAFLIVASIIYSVFYG